MNKGEIMEMQVLFDSLREINRQRATIMRDAHRDDATALVIRDAIRLAKGRVPLTGQIALAAARLKVRLESFDQLRNGTGDAAVNSADDAWVRSYWADQHANLDANALERIRASLAGSAPAHTCHRHNVVEILIEMAQDEAEQGFYRAAETWVRENHRPLRLAAERTVVVSADIPKEVRADLLSVIDGDNEHVNARSVTYDWVRGLNDAIEALKLNGTFRVDAESKPLEFKALVAFVRNVRDPTWSQMLALPGGVENALRWIAKTYRSRDSSPVALENPPTLADSLDAGDILKGCRTAQAHCSAAWKELTAAT